MPMRGHDDPRSSFIRRVVQIETLCWLMLGFLVLRNVGFGGPLGCARAHSSVCMWFLFIPCTLFRRLLRAVHREKLQVCSDFQLTQALQRNIRSVHSNTNALEQEIQLGRKHTEFFHTFFKTTLMISIID